MWRAFLESVQENPVPNDTLNVNVRFEDADTGKSYVKTYNLHAGANASVEGLQKVVTAELETIELLTPGKSELEALVGQEIARVGKGGK